MTPSKEYHHVSTSLLIKEYTQETDLKTLKHRKADLINFAAYRNICFKCTYYFSFLLSKTKGHSLNCLSTAQTTVKKHKLQHLEHKRQKQCLPELNSNLTLSLGDKRDTHQQNSSAFHKCAKNLSSASPLPPASRCLPWQGSINYPIPGQQGLLPPHHLSLQSHDGKLGENLGQYL